MTTNKELEYILCAAVKPEDRPLIAGFRHCDVYQMIRHYEVLSREDSVRAKDACYCYP